MERTGIDRRSGMEVPVKKSKRTSRFEYLTRSGPAVVSLLTSSSMTLAAFIAVALLYGCDGYFFDGYFGNTAWKASADRRSFSLLTAYTLIQSWSGCR
jgi:hypothetical protein